MNRTKPSAALNSHSRNYANSIVVILACCLALAVGNGCINLKNAKTFEIDTPFADFEYEAKENVEE